MERRPELSRRPASFNPEAATFSPTVAKAGAPVRAAEPTPPASPQHRSAVPDEVEESPFRPAREMRPIYQAYDGPSVSQLSSAPPDPVYMALDDLQDLLRALTQDRPEPARNVATSMDSINKAMPYNPPSVFSTQRLEPSISIPEVEELSKNLGLPGMVKKNKTDEDESLLYDQSLRNFKPHAKDSLHAQYLSGQTDLDYPASALRNLHGHGLTTPQEKKSGEDPPKRIVQPPPGFGGERPREILTEEHGAPSFSVLESPFVPTGPAAHGRPRRFSDLQSVNAQQQPQYDRTRRSSVMRPTRPRAPTRTRRTDQGPEPSAADIYPDDAIWMSPRRDPYTPEPISTFSSYMPNPARPQTFNIARDTTSWPTPAEVYAAQNTKQTPSSQPSAFAQTTTTPGSHFDLFADHRPPTKADIDDADADVETLISVLPDLFQLELHGALSDERPLTQNHVDGTRYGKWLYGIGLGDSWKGPDVDREDAFKARW